MTSAYAKAERRANSGRGFGSEAGQGLVEGGLADLHAGGGLAHGETGSEKSPGWGADIGRAQNHAKETNEERSLGWSDAQGPSSPERRYSSHVARPRALMVNLSGLLGALSSRPNLTNGRIELALITSLSSGS